MPILTDEDLDILIDEIKSLRRVVVDLQLKVAELEQRPWVDYRLIWAPGRYTRGQAVTHDGSFWLCIEDATTARPGTPDPASRAWKLAVKRGKDGKECSCDGSRHR